MELNIAIKAFAALAQETRLQVFRLLVKAGKLGLAAGSISEQLNIPKNTLSFHLNQLHQANLVSSYKNGRNHIYSANFAFTKEVINFMVENCCATDEVSCDLASYKNLSQIQEESV